MQQEERMWRDRRGRVRVAGIIHVNRYRASQWAAAALLVGIGIGACYQRWAHSCAPSIEVLGWVGDAVDQACLNTSSSRP